MAVTCPTVEFQRLKTNRWGTGQGGGDHPVEPLDFPAGAIGTMVVLAPALALLCLSQPVTGQARKVHRHTHGGDHPEVNSSVSCDFISRFDPQAV